MGQIVGKKRFRELCGGTTVLSAKHLNTYISRNKVIIEDDGMIDIDNEINQAFVMSRLSIKENNDTKQVTPPEKKTVAKKPNKLKVNSKTKSFDSEEIKEFEEVDNRSEVEVSKMTMAELQTEKERRTVRKLGEEIELKRIQKEKLMGVVIPTDVVKSVFARQMKAVTTAFYQGVKDITITTAHRFKASKQDIGDMNKELIDIINASIKESRELGLKEIESIVNEYSDTRLQGEKKT